MTVRAIHTRPGTRWIRPEGFRRAARFVLVLTAGAVPGGVAGQSPAAQSAGCELCHGELELLRQHVAAIDDARALLARSGVIEASAHAGMPCAECHSGFGRFPHPEAGSTDSCVSCHSEAADLWADGAHASEDGADCVACHGVHDVQWAEDLAAGAGALGMNANCAACHEENGLLSDDPHAKETPCAGCHAAHDTRAADDPRAGIARRNQVVTCLECHTDDETPAWEDTHRTALEDQPLPGDGGPRDPPDTGESPPSCTDCHGSHPLHSAEYRASAIDSICATCHEDYGESFTDSYHGRARQLGGEAAAGCASCHTGHAIFPADDERSSVSPVNLVQSCGACHDQASANFAGFQPHATLDDRERYPHVYWSTMFMQSLLFGVFGVFGVHTLLWIGRSALDARRGVTAHPRKRSD